MALGNSVIWPAGVMWAIRPGVGAWGVPISVNQRLPSEAATMPVGLLPALGMANSVTCPAGVIRPMLLPARSVNQRLPSGPVVMPQGRLV
jgi:hypothetical protein